MNHSTAYESSTSAGTNMAPGPLFIVAMWRGGSSLLYRLLNKHPQVALTFEADLWLLRSMFRKPMGHGDWAERWDLRGGALRRHGIVANDLPRGAADYAAAFTAAHKAFAARKGAVIWGDKSPIYSDSLPALARLFPQAKYIVQWRDPAATANAIARAAQSGAAAYRKRGVYLRGLIGYEVLKTGVDFLLSRGQPVCQVTYEELTGDPAKVMREVCGFLEIPYRDELADLRGADQSAIFKESHHSLARGEEIVSRPRTVILEPAVRRKIDGYVKLWKRRYNNEWPLSILPDASNVAIPQLSQRLADHVAYRAVRAFNQFRQACYAYAPLGLIQRLRRRRRGARFPADTEASAARE